MAGHTALDREIGVRIPAPQPVIWRILVYELESPEECGITGCYFFNVNKGVLVLYKDVPQYAG